MAHQGRMITLDGSDGFAFGAYRVLPQKPAHAGLVLAMEIFGVTDHIKDLCDGFAAEGYDVIAPALYDRAERDFEATYSNADIEKARRLLGAVGYAHTEGDIQAAIDLL